MGRRWDERGPWVLAEETDRYTRNVVKWFVEPVTGGRDDLEDHPDPGHDGEPIIDRRQGEWRRPSYVLFMATSASTGDPE